MVEKAPDAFRNISEVSSLLNVPAHVLRFWETRFTQIKPVKRSGGRRYYRPEDITLLTRIRDLLYAEGYTIKGAQQVLRTGSADSGNTNANAPADASMPSAEMPNTAKAMALLKEASLRLNQLSQTI